MKLSRPVHATFALLTFLSLGGCGGGYGDSGGPTDPGGNDRTIKADPSFQNDVFEIFQRRGCTASSCHGGGAGGLTMTSVSGAYGNLVNQAAVGKSGEVRVIPGQAEASYLVKKLEGANGIVGARMPATGSALDNIDLTNIKNWIDNGAANN